MKTKAFEPGAICAAVALLLVLSPPSYAKSGGSSASHTRVGKTCTNTTLVKPVTSSRKTQLGTVSKAGATSTIPGTGPVIGAGASSVAGQVKAKDAIIAKQREDGTAEYKRKNSPPIPCVGRNC